MNAAPPRNNKMPMTPAALLTALFLGLGMLAGCGSSSSSPNVGSTTSKATPARQTPLLSTADTGRPQAQGKHVGPALGQLQTSGAKSTKPGGTAVVTGSHVVQARPTPATSNDDKSARSAKPLNPCSLVPLSEAQSITAGAVTALTEAPLGPTCIYHRPGTTGITLAIETQSFSDLTKHMTGRQAVVVRGHRSLCGRLGAQMLFVPLTDHQLLNVTAPCGVAKRFAALALSRLAA